MYDFFISPQNSFGLGVAYFLDATSRIDIVLRPQAVSFCYGLIYECTEYVAANSTTNHRRKDKYQSRELEYSLSHPTQDLPCRGEGSFTFREEHDSYPVVSE